MVASENTVETGDAQSHVSSHVSGHVPAHIPVLLAEVLQSLEPLTDKIIVDGTFGAGGYSRALLAAGAQVIGIDRDPNVMPHVEKLRADYPDHFTFYLGEFAELDALVQDQADIEVDAVVLDIGVSSMQLDEAERGFSFMRDGPLDMRMGQSGVSAANLVNEMEEIGLANLLFGYGEERKSRRIAKAIAARRVEQEFSTTTDLANLIEATIGRKPGTPHPATRSFQALRIAVNAEFEQLVHGLFAAERLLSERGVLSVVTFHSLEDRIVKRFFAPKSSLQVQSRHLPQHEKSSDNWTKVAKATKAGKDELERNPRARSATLRSGRRTKIAARDKSNAGLGVPGVNWRGVE